MSLDQVPEEARPGGLGLLVADGQMQEVLPALGVDAPRHEQGLFDPLAAERLEDGVAEQMLDLDLGQVPGDEGLAVLPQLVRDLGERELEDEQLACGIPEGVLDVSCRKAPGVHLGHEAIEHVGVAVQKAPSARQACRDHRSPSDRRFDRHQRRRHHDGHDYLDAIGFAPGHLSSFKARQAKNVKTSRLAPAFRL